MAINYLNTVNLNKNQLENAAIQNLATDPASGVLGQVYYNTAVSELKICTTASVVSPASNAVWTVAGSYDYWVLDADGNGATANITNGATADFVGGLKITTNSTAGGVLNIVHDLQTQTDTTSTGAPAYGGTFTTVDSVTRDTTGHVTGINVKTVTIPASDNTTYDLASAVNSTAGVNINLTGSDSSTDTVNIIGTANEVAITQTSTANKLQIGLSADVTVSNDLTVSNDISVDGEAAVSGASEFTGLVTASAGVAITTGTLSAGANTTINLGANRVTNIADPTSAQDAATKAYVDTSVTGLLQFQGGFNANTGAIDGGGNLTTGGSRIAIAVGDYYVVTTAGDFFGNAATPLTVGDSVIVKTAKAAGASVEADFIVVQSDTDLATASTVGLGNVAAGTGISVAYSNGTATVTATSNGARQDLLSSDTNVTRTESGGLTTFALNVGAILGSTNALNVKAEIISAAGQTVYADITRSGTTLNVIFTGSVADSAYQALLIDLA